MIAIWNMFKENSSVYFGKKKYFGGVQYKISIIMEHVFIILILFCSGREILSFSMHLKQISLEAI